MALDEIDPPAPRGEPLGYGCAGEPRADDHGAALRP